jgi:hypothetical protein
LVLRNEERGDNIYAVDFCTAVTWNESPFELDTKLRRAIDKTLSHLTYARDLQGPHLQVAFDGRLHGHGTVKLIRNAWSDFNRSLDEENRDRLEEWTRRYTSDFGLSFDDLTGEFEQDAKDRASREEWQLNTTPDGLVG